MSAEKISNATQFYPEYFAILTDERGLVTDEGEVLFPSLVNGKPDPVVARTLGVNNIKRFNDIATAHSKMHLDQKTPEDLALQIEANSQWHNHLVRRELTVRAVELSLLTQSSVDVFAIEELSSSDPNYDVPHGIFKKTDLDLTHIAKWAAHDLKTDKSLSLGDLVATVRLRREMEIAKLIGDLMSKATNRSTIIPKNNGHGRKLRKASLLRKDTLDSGKEGVAFDDALLAVDLLTFGDGIWKEAFTPDQRELVEATEATMKYMLQSRANSHRYQLKTREPGEYRYFPSNLDTFKEAGLQLPGEEKQPEREKVVVITEEERSEAIKKRAERTAAEQARIETEKAKAQAEQQAAMEHDQPILEGLNEIARRYNSIVDTYTKQTGKSLRDKGLTGKDSLAYRLSQLKDYDPNMTDSSVQVYAKLYEIAATSEDPTGELTDTLLELERIRDEYESFANSHRLRTNAKPDQLQDSFKPELTLLTHKWNGVKSAIRSSGHSSLFTAEIGHKLEEMLGLQPSEVVTEPPLEPEVIEISESLDEENTEAIVDHTDSITEPIVTTIAEPEPQVEPVDHESPLEKANRLAERLDWVMMPEEEVTPEELVDIAEKALEGKGGRGDRKPAVIEQYRMETLLELRNRYGGSLYRSSEKMLGDNDNLYFALRFKHLGDENHYVVTENPVYGNATYVIREDLLPLMPGETALTAIKLHRRHVRELGAQRIIHGAATATNHMEKVESRIETLAEIA